ncbi:MAG: phosphogluconate dehydratase [Moraxellaceae bacterium]|nr:MAG: phosphogluconate dehydratase [Moraxellaceae bacterium]
MSITSSLNKTTQQIVLRSEKHRERYLALMSQQHQQSPSQKLTSTNLAHAYAASSEQEKLIFRGKSNPINLGIISAYNDLLSAHQPLKNYPDKIKRSALKLGCTAQFAAGVPAMCDGVTQGQTGMQLSLFSRDLIAQTVAIALSHQLFNGVLMLGVCDKIVPGLLIGALRFGFLPALMIPAGPMSSGLDNETKADFRKKFVQGEIDKHQLLEVEQKAYHEPGTCTFYGTANTNQIMMEMLGLNLPGSSFIHPTSPLREKLIDYSTKILCQQANDDFESSALCYTVNAYSMVNAMVVMLATGGSTNLAIHLVAIARSAGIIINWDDFDDLSKQTPLIAKMYPNGPADINEFSKAGGLSVVISELKSAGLLHDNIRTPLGEGLDHLKKIPYLEGDNIKWHDDHAAKLQMFGESSLSENNSVIASVKNPFDKVGGLALVKGNLGRALIKVSAVSKENQSITAPAICFSDQESLKKAYQEGLLYRDFVAVIRFQGPKAMGMPELHQLTPILLSIQSKGHRVALLTDGRMSGASGAVLAAIHLVPEAIDNEILRKIKDDDVIHMDAKNGILRCEVEPKELEMRTISSGVNLLEDQGLGREMFEVFRNRVSDAELGASIFLF